MEAVNAWLEARKRAVARANELRAVNPNSAPPPTSFMSLFPELVQAPQPQGSDPNLPLVLDAELNPNRIYEFASRGGGGVCTIMKQVYYENRQPRNKPFERFTANELDAAFSFSTIIVPKPTAPTPALGEESIAPSHPRKRPSSAAPMPPKRSKSTTPAPPAAPAVPRTATPHLPASPAPPPPLPPLPPTAAAAAETTAALGAGNQSSPAAITAPTPPPLPPPRTKTPPPLPLAKQPSSSSVLKLPGIIKLPLAPASTAAASAAAAARDDDVDSYASDADLDIAAPEDTLQGGGGVHQQQQQQQLQQPTVLKQELLLTVNTLIHITNWPKATRPLVQSFKTTGYPEGNPFAVVLKRGCTYVPDDYFDMIERPMDLSTIRDRVQANYYLTLAMFESDVQLVVSNAMRYNTLAGPLKLMAAHLQSTAKAELEGCKYRLTRASSQN